MKKVTQVSILVLRGRVIGMRWLLIDWIAFVIENSIDDARHAEAF